MSPGPEAEAPSASAQQLGRRALSLGAASAFDYAIQFLLPAVLVRCLDPHAFGEYRLLWLAVGTVMSVVTLAVAGSLNYYLPRADAEGKRLYINQALLVHAIVGIVAGVALSSANPWLPVKLRELTAPTVAVPAFVALWVFASILDVLPAIEERVRWQARAVIGLATVRALSLSLVAAITGELVPVLYAMLAFVVLRVALMLWYVARNHGLRGPLVRAGALLGMLRLAAPFWASAALYSLRNQADQWVAATLFPLAMFASFTIAAVLAPLVNIFRQSINYAFLPSMSRLEAAGNVRAMLEMNSRANVMVAGLVFPLFGLAFVFAEEIVSFVYTSAYVDAAPVMRVYIVGLAALVVELSGVTLLLREGPFMMGLNLFTLVIASALNWTLAQRLGLPGAAVGTVITMYVDRIATLRRIALRTGIGWRELQDWRALGMLLAASCVAALLAWFVVVHFLAARAPLLQMAAGGSVLVAVYVVLAAGLGRRRGWVAFARAARAGSASWRA